MSILHTLVKGGNKQEQRLSRTWQLQAQCFGSYATVRLLLYMPEAQALGCHTSVESQEKPTLSLAVWTYLRGI